jgi:hypothetical protein
MGPLRGGRVSSATWRERMRSTRRTGSDVDGCSREPRMERRRPEQLQRAVHSCQVLHRLPSQSAAVDVSRSRCLLAPSRCVGKKARGMCAFSRREALGALREVSCGVGHAVLALPGLAALVERCQWRSWLSAYRRKTCM